MGLVLGAVTLSEAAATETLTALVEHATRPGLACYVYGLSSPALVKVAAPLRFDDLSGPAIARAVNAPQGVIAKVVDDL